ncbi:MAG: methyl-accepting chemotaxis protein, partial [Gemmatimonadota bacterium]
AAQQGHGFAVVAEQVRTLAGEAGRSARDVSNGVAELRDGIAQVADAISAGEERLLETSRVAGEARTTLERLGLSISHTLELVSESASARAQHVGGIASLRDRLSALSAEKDKWASGFAEIEGAINEQVSAVDELSAARQQLLQLTQQLQTTATQIRDTTESSD